MNQQLPEETADQAYRRGYLAGYLAALDYAGEGKDLAWLYRFRQQVLEQWAYNSPLTDDHPAPLPGHYVETEDGWIHL